MNNSSYPKNEKKVTGMIGVRNLIIEFVEGEEAEEIETFAENQKRILEQKIKEKKERRTEINRTIAKKKKNKKNDNQLYLFENL